MRYIDQENLIKLTCGHPAAGCDFLALLPDAMNIAGFDE